MENTWPSPGFDTKKVIKELIKHSLGKYIGSPLTNDLKEQLHKEILSVLTKYVPFSVDIDTVIQEIELDMMKEKLETLGL